MTARSDATVKLEKDIFYTVTVYRLKDASKVIVHRKKIPTHYIVLAGDGSILLSPEDCV